VSHYKGRDVFENLSPEILRRLEGAEARATG
jgi:hypothetical protein